MMDPKTEKKAEQWSDDIPDPEEEQAEPYEETYRDGTNAGQKNEICHKQYEGVTRDEKPRMG